MKKKKKGSDPRRERVHNKGDIPRQGKKKNDQTMSLQTPNPFTRTTSERIIKRNTYGGCSDDYLQRHLFCVMPLPAPNHKQIMTIVGLNDQIVSHPNKESDYRKLKAEQASSRNRNVMAMQVFGPFWNHSVAFV
jgi:hypothetical protein